MADDCSRLGHLSDSQLLAHFNLHYPQPLSWRMCHLSGKAVEAGVDSSCAAAAAANSTWVIWQRFCVSLDTEENFSCGTNPLTVLQFITQRYRDRQIAPSKRQVRSRIVEDAVQSVGQGFARMGAQDPRLNASGSIDFRLQRQLAGYAKADPSPTRVKPIPLSIVMCYLRIARAVATISNCAIADMICLALFCMCHCEPQTRISLSRMPNYLWIITASMCSPALTPISTLSPSSVSPLPTRNTRLGRSGSPDCCPVQCIIRRVKDIRL
jgi:hypothetical protein